MAVPRGLAGRNGAVRDGAERIDRFTTVIAQRDPGDEWVNGQNLVYVRMTPVVERFVWTRRSLAHRSIA